MKKLFFFIVIGGFTVIGNTVNAQLRKVPAGVRQTFSVKYPQARDVRWRDKITNWESDFTMDGNRYESTFDRKGHWQRTDERVMERSLPVAVKEGLKKSKYNSWRINSAHVRYYADGDRKYHIRAEKNSWRKKDLVFNKRGQLLSDNIAI